MSTSENIPDHKKVETVTRYACSDGKEFYSLTSAQHHADDIDDAFKANEILMAGGTVEECLIGSGWKHPIDSVLSRVTKETPLIIGHWQCRDTPGYKVQEFKPGRIVFVYGHAGSWSGPYGNEMSLRDLSRYAEDTEIKSKPNS